MDARQGARRAGAPPGASSRANGRADAAGRAHGTRRVRPCLRGVGPVQHARATVSAGPAPAPRELIDAAVLVPVYRDAAGELRLVLVRRTEGGPHGGPIA